MDMGQWIIENEKRASGRKNGEGVGKVDNSG
jgi:hypothetical protein